MDLRKKIFLAHSPDADDIFMYMAINFGWIGGENPREKHEEKITRPGLIYHNAALDIQSLNEAALANIYEVCAISFALYPLIATEYALLRTAVSFGEGYGPKLIKKRGTILKKNFTVALSGAHTTNALLFRLRYPEARIIYMNFLKIEEAVLSGKADAGVLIHESILDFDSSLCVELEFWDLWQDLAGGVAGDLPLPLGGMALRRSLPIMDAIKIEKELMSAIKIADENRPLMARMLIERGLVRVDEKRLDIYLDLYANKSSICMDERQLRAVDKLFELGFDHGFFDRRICAQDHFIPLEYEGLRNL